MNREQMIAWLTLEGYQPYNNPCADMWFTASADGKKGLYYFSDGTTRRASVYPSEITFSWSDVPFDEVEAFYEELSGEPNMTHEQMVAWLILEGWVPCISGPEDGWAPGVFNRDRDLSAVDFTWGVELGVWGGSDNDWSGVDDWNNAGRSFVRKFYKIINEQFYNAL